MVGVLGTVAAGGVFGLFSATTQNAGNEISTGIVALSDNDNGSAMFNVTNAKPGDTWTRCIKVTYGGTLAADVHLYLKDGTGPLGPHISMTDAPGHAGQLDVPSCTRLHAGRQRGRDRHRLRGTGPRPADARRHVRARPAAGPFGQDVVGHCGTSQVYEFDDDARRQHPGRDAGLVDGLADRRLGGPQPLGVVGRTAMSAPSLHVAVRVAGALLGAGVALALLIAARPSASFARLPASAGFTIPVSGELAVTPAPGRPFLRARR